MTRWQLTATDWLDPEGEGSQYAGRRKDPPRGINPARLTWTGKNELTDRYRGASSKPMTSKADERAGLIVQNIHWNNRRGATRAD